MMASAYKKGDKALVKVGSATTNEQLRSWCINHELVTLPLNVIMVEITVGGSNAPIWYVHITYCYASSNMEITAMGPDDGTKH